jgi:hypothetical protein
MSFDYTKIHRYPYPIPEEVIDNLRRKKLAFFIGAGVSRIIGCKGWEEFASSLLLECNKRKYIDHLEYENLKQEKDLKKIITIVYSIFDEKKEMEEFFNLFKNSLAFDSDLKKEYDIYSLLIKFEAVYITTNADSHFDSFFPENNRIYTFTKDMQIEQGKLYHIHGMESYPESLVFTIDQYLNKYNDSYFREFLNKLFKDYIIVFIGYGLGEYEVLDFLVEKTYSKTHNELKHFFVKAFFSNEDYILKHDRRYFDRLGMNIVGYEKDKLGFAELYKLLESWERECHLSTSLIIAGLDDIEKKVKTVKTESEIDELIKFIESRSSFKNYFFTILSKNITLAAKFFTYFMKNEYFDPKNNPPVKEIEDKPGYFSIPYWDMLDYLIIISNYLKQENDPETNKNLKKVINNLINDPAKRRNYHTDRILIALMFSFSEDNIDNIYIEFLRIALESNISNMVVSGTIYEKVFPICSSLSDDKILYLLDIILDYKKAENAYYKEYFSFLDGYYLSQFIRNYIDDIYIKVGNKLIDILISKLEKISDATLPLYGLDQLSVNFDKSQLDETKYDEMMVIALYGLLNKLDKTNRNNYINKFRKNDSNLFKKMTSLIENAKEIEVQTNIFWDNTRTYSVSPYSTDELLVMSTEAICKEMHRELPEFGWDDPCHQGFIESLHAMIAKSPQKITDFYNSYLQIPPRYINAILYGFLKNARNKVPMNWDNVFNYAIEIIQSPNFKDIEEKRSKFIPEMPILSIVADLIYYYFDGYIVNETLYEKLKKQLFYILSISENIDFDLFSDIGSMALNTTIGKSYYALLKLIKFYAECHSEDNNKWDEEISSYFISLLNSDSTHLILCYIFGESFPLFVWLNKDYIFSKFQSIMKNKNIEQWNTFIHGYFNSNYNFNSDIYILLRENGIYEKVMADQEIFSKFNRLKMNEHACIAYFRKLEDIKNENSLIRQIILAGDKDDIHYIKDIIWRQREYLKTIDDGDVKNLWMLIVDTLSQKLIDNNTEFDNVIAELLSFLSVIKTIDKKVLICVEFSIKHSTENNLPFFIIPDLTELFIIDLNKDNILKIMDMLITRNILVLYREKEIKKLVEMIYQYNQEYASRISNAYLERGYYFLSDFVKKQA